MSNSVWLGGQVRNVYRQERNWELFVSLSSDEGQGMAILEAMALGVPVLAPIARELQDYLKDGKNAIALKSDSITDRRPDDPVGAGSPEDDLKSCKAREMVEGRMPGNKPCWEWKPFMEFGKIADWHQTDDRSMHPRG